MAKSDEVYHHGDLRAALIEVGLRTLERAGPAQISLRALAAEAGVSRSAPYSHFAGKEALVAAIAGVGFDRFRDEMLSASTGGADARARFLDIGRGYVRFALANPGLFKLMFSADFAPLRAYGDIDAGSRRAYAVFRDGLTAFLAQRGAPPPDPALETLTWSVIHGLTVLLLEARLPPPHPTGTLVEDVTETFARMLEQSLDAGAGTARPA